MIEVTTLLISAGISASLVEKYTLFLVENRELSQGLRSFFDGKDKEKVPLFIYKEASQEIVTLFADQKKCPTEPGEKGSILAYVRQHAYEDDFMASDCYGQLSCSSCAVEVLQGTLYNPDPREEEYDMLDIDLDRPPTRLTRLGCQAIIGDEALVVKIRA